MQYRPLGNSGISASVIGLGTWVLGGGRVWGADPDDDESIRTIQAALDTLSPQLVLAWTAAQPGVTHVLVGGRTLAQATENAKAGALKLDAADVARIQSDVVALGEPVKG